MSDNESKFVLTKVSEGPGFVAYRMGLPGTRMESTDIMFTSAPLDARIIITGDFDPGNHTDGVISNHGYGLAWFVRQSPGGYLCEKFLRTGYHPEHARRVLRSCLEEVKRELAEDEPDDVRREKLESRAEALSEAIEAEDGYGDPTVDGSAFYEFITDTFGNSDYCEGATGYDPDEARRLGKIQQRFARLYTAMGDEQ